MKVKRLRCGRWQARWRDDKGKQRARNFVERPTMEDLAALERETPKALQTTFSAFAKEWLTEHAPVTRSKALLVSDRSYVEKHLVPLFGNRDLSTLKKADLVRAKPVLLATIARAGRQKTGKTLSPKTVNTILSLAKQIMETAFELDLVEGTPWAKVDLLPVPKQVQRYWSFDEKERFLAHNQKVDPGFAELVLVALETGLRKGELMALRVSDLDFERGRIWVGGTYQSTTKERLDRTKNGAVDDFVPMTSRVRSVLAARRGGVGLVFDRKLFPDYYGRLKRRARAAGVTPIRFHDLRHTFASHLVMRGVPLYAVQKLMRHSSSAMTERYAKFSPDSLADAVSALNVHGEGGERTQDTRYLRGLWRSQQGSNPVAPVLEDFGKLFELEAISV